MIRRARLVTAADSNMVVLWEKDANGDGMMSLMEMAVVYLHTPTQRLQVRRISFPDDWPDWKKEYYAQKYDQQVNLAYATSVSAAWSMVSSSSYDVDTTLAENVQAFKIDVLPPPPLTTFVSLAMTVGSGEQSVTIRRAAHLRLPEVDRVAVYNGQYVLMPPNSNGSSSYP